MKHIRFGTYLLLWLAILAIRPMEASASTSLLEASGLRGGILFLPKTTDPLLPTQLAGNSAFIVFAQAQDATTLAAIQAGAMEENLLGRRLYAAQAPISHLPLAAHSAAIVMITDLELAEATDENLDRWFAALAPERGVAVLGNPDRTRLDLEVLKTRIEARPGVYVRRAVDGAYLLCGKRAPEAADVWSHKFHDPANTRTSTDGLLKAPFAPAWYALPLHLGYWGDTLVADHGRGYLLWANRAHLTRVSLICFDLRSGQRLWERPFSWNEPRNNNHSGYYSGRSCMIAADDRLILIDEADVLVLNGETGAETLRITGPKPGGQIKWMGSENGLLAVMAGDPDVFKTSSLQQQSTNPFGRELAVYDLTDGRLLWSDSEGGDVDERELAIADATLYYHARNHRVVARNLRTGAVLWETRDPKTLELLADHVLENLGGMLYSVRVLAATPSTLYFASTLRHQRVTLDRKDGALLWTAPTDDRGRALRDTLHGDDLFQKQGRYNIITGEQIADFRVPSSGCGPSLIAGESFITQFGEVRSLDGQLLRAADLKSPCDVGVVVSSGIAVSTPSVCRCALEIHGFRAFSGSEPLGPASGKPVFEKGPAFDAPAEAKNPAPLDWPVFRANNRRSNSTKAEIRAEAPALAWQWHPAQTNPSPLPATGYGAKMLDSAEYLPTQAVSVGDTVYFADAQGVVRAVEAEQGRERWQFAVGTKIHSAPAFHRGRILVGASDGVVYCLDARDGKLAWAYRVPEQERRIMWYGHLVSSWPLLGGVVAEDGVVYAVAGLQSGNGMYAVALDVATGAPLWTQSAEVTNNAQPSPGLMGTLALAGDKIYFSAGDPIPASLDRKTGALHFTPDIRFSGDQRYGRDMAVVNDEWLFYGGRKAYADFSSWVRPGKSMGYSFCQSKPDLSSGPLVTVGAAFADETMLPPVFDDEIIVAAHEYPPRNGQATLQVWKIADVMARLAQMPSGVPRPHQNKNAPYTFRSLTNPNASLPEGGIWSDVRLPVFAAVLSGNAVLVIHPAGGDKQEIERWQLAALHRDSGAALWTIDLPGRPAWDALSIAADGSILVSMWDGSLLCYQGKN